MNIAQWLSVWRQLGWLPDIAATLSARSVATVPALRRGAGVLIRADKVPEGAENYSVFLQWLARLPNVAGVPAARRYEEPFGEETVCYSESFRPKSSGQN